METPTLEHVEEQLRHLSPASLAIVAQFISSLEAPVEEKPGDDVPYGDPWAGFYGAFEADVPDLLERHDFYIGQEALDPHAPHDGHVTSQERMDDSASS